LNIILQNIRKTFYRILRKIYLSRVIDYASFNTASTFAHNYD